jgi:DNA repair protein RadD
VKHFIARYFLACVMTIKFRSYQVAAVDAVENYWRFGGSCLVSAAISTGKSLVLAELARRDAALGKRILIATHVRELIEQDVVALESLWPGAPYGICSAGLGHRNHDNTIIFGTVQTLSRDLEKLGRFDLVIMHIS